MADYVGYDPVSLGLTVKHSAGLNNVLCACPWHGGSDSLCVNLQTGQFICYSCGEKGGPAKLVAKTGGVPVWTTFQKPSPSEQELQWRKLLDGDFAYDNEYLVGRQVTNEQVEKFHIIENSQGIIFPLTNDQGTVVGTLIRRREGKVRYVTLGEKPPLWPLHLFQDQAPNDSAVIVEGIFGVLSADRAEMNAFATLGASVKKSAFPYFQRVQPWVVFDDDLAGYVGAYRILQDCTSAHALVPGLEADELSPKDWQGLFRSTRMWKWAGAPDAFLGKVGGMTQVEPRDVLSHVGKFKKGKKK